MASAIKKITPPAVPVVEYVLTLSKDEAQTLADVLSKFGGNPYQSRRKHIHTLVAALGSVDVVYKYPVSDLVRNGDGDALYFTYGDGKLW